MKKEKVIKEKNVKEEKETNQRVFKNNGKRFEEDLKESFGPHIWTYRPPDNGGGMMARFTHESLCDLMAYNTVTKNFVLMELKSTLGTSVSFKPYAQCEAYEKAKADFEDWNAGLTVEERKKLKEDIQLKKREIKTLYKETNSAMIKYHQIQNLLETQQKFGITSYILFVFFKTANCYALPIESFVDFWKDTDKKSLNEKDLEEMISRNAAFAVPQEYIRRTVKSRYSVDFLTETDFPSNL